jgi:hypothetical protein
MRGSFPSWRHVIVVSTILISPCPMGKWHILISTKCLYDKLSAPSVPLVAKTVLERPLHLWWRSCGGDCVAVAAARDCGCLSVAEMWVCGCAMFSGLPGICLRVHGFAGQGLRAVPTQIPCPARHSRNEWVGLVSPEGRRYARMANGNRRGDALSTLHRQCRDR